MKVEVDGGFIREALATFAEAEAMMVCMRDWPNGGWNLNRCNAHVSYRWDDSWLDGKTDFKALWVLCTPEPIGFAGVKYFSGSITGFQVDFLAINPIERGKGKFTAFSDGLAWLANQHFGADVGHYEVVESAPQVRHRSEALGGSIEGKKVHLTKGETAKHVKAARFADAPADGPKGRDPATTGSPVNPPPSGPRS